MSKQTNDFSHLQSRQYHCIAIEATHSRLTRELPVHHYATRKIHKKPWIPMLQLTRLFTYITMIIDVFLIVISY